jgi:hypothetical protein
MSIYGAAAGTPSASPAPEKTAWCRRFPQLPHHLQRRRGSQAGTLRLTGETWRFEGAAERTLILLQDFARAGSGFDSLVKSCFPDLFKPN